MTSTLEQTRQDLEDLETLKHLASAALQSRPSAPTAHARLSQAGHQVPTPLHAAHLTRSLLHLAAARAAAARAHLSAAPPPPRAPDPDPLSAFYARLRDLRDAHRPAAHAPTAPQPARDAALLAAAAPPPHFSGEEAAARCLDLQPHYLAYLNIIAAPSHPPHPRAEYCEYVAAAATDFARVAPAARASAPYLRYLEGLLRYLVAFARRAHPLHRVDDHVAGARRRAEADLRDRLARLAAVAPGPEDVLARLGGAEGVKRELLELGLKCGGRAEDRAERLLRAARDLAVGQRAVTERVVRFVLAELLAEERAATVANVRKKLSLSFAELEAERVAEEAGLDGAARAAEDDGRGEDGAGEGVVYNPKDVPLGWDGKPIPYWMYKLHGLNHEFQCEICGNATYRGPRAFERHFTDAQHVHGLRCLGIGYSKAFMMITRIKDAVSLQQRLEREGAHAHFDDGDVEFEDGDGNLLKRKTYEDLVRQGLL